MQTSWDQRARREGIFVKNVSFPVPLPSPECFVGRIREDWTVPNWLHMWVVADNILKGAALNAVQIAEVIIKK